MNEPDYYVSNGLSPIGAFKQGLMSEDEYRGFLIGNIIKYTVRAGKKENAVKDLNKAKHYLDFYLELVKSDIGNIPVTLTVDNDIDMTKFEEDIKNALEEANQKPVMVEVLTDDPHIVKLKTTDIMYDEDGKLKPEARDAVREYLLERRKQ